MQHEPLRMSSPVDLLCFWITPQLYHFFFKLLSRNKLLIICCVSAVVFVKLETERTHVYSQVIMGCPGNEVQVNDGASLTRGNRASEY